MGTAARATSFATTTVLVGCNGASTPSAGTGATSFPTNGAVVENARSPVPPDGACNTGTGVTTRYTGDVQSFAVDDQFAYVIGAEGLNQIPVAGGAPTLLRASVGDLSATTTPLAVGPNAVFVGDGNSETLSSIAISNDASAIPIYGSTAFDGANAYFQIAQQPDAVTIAQAPLAGGAPIVTPIGSMIVSEIAVGQGAIFVAGGIERSDGAILRVPIDRGAPILVFKENGFISRLTVDEASIYFYDGYDGDRGIKRIALDGTGLVTLASQSVAALAVDSHALYFVGDDGLSKIDKTTLDVSSITATRPQLANSIVIRGGNIYVSAETGGADSGPQIIGSLVTLSK